LLSITISVLTVSRPLMSYELIHLFVSALGSVFFCFVLRNDKSY